MMNMNPMQFLSQMKQNPASVLGQRFNVPNGMNDPNQIINHLVNSGQVSPQQINRLMGMQNNPILRSLFGMK
jgi:hypothetical protein